MRSGRRVCKKWWDGFWMQTITQIPTKTYFSLFSPCTMLLEICMQIYSAVFALSRQINKQKHAKTINLLCASNKVFVKYQAQGGGVNAQNSHLRTPLANCTWIWVSIGLSYVSVWPGLSRCPVPVSKMSRNFTSVKFSKWTPTWWCIVMK